MTISAKEFTRHTELIGQINAEFTRLDALVAAFNLALSGNLIFTVTPAEVASDSNASGGWTRSVVISVTNGGDADTVMTWFNKTIASGVAIADDSTAGTASIESTSLVFVDGVCTVEITGDDADWADGETNTLTVAEATILGVTCSAKTSVETFTT